MQSNNAVSKTISQDAPIIIVGAGAWGLSTALHLRQAGHTDVTVFERAERVPSPYSAAWDINKIVRPEYEDGFYTELALVSQGPLYSLSFSLNPGAEPANFAANRTRSKAGKPLSSDHTSTRRGTS